MGGTPSNQIRGNIKNTFNPNMASTHGMVVP